MEKNATKGTYIPYKWIAYVLGKSYSHTRNMLKGHVQKTQDVDRAEQDILSALDEIKLRYEREKHLILKRVPMKPVNRKVRTPIEFNADQVAYTTNK